MKKISYFLLSSLITLILLVNQNSISAVFDEEFLNNQAYNAYSEYTLFKRSIELTYSPDSPNFLDETYFKENAHNFSEWKNKFANTLQRIKDQSFENFLIFFSHFMNYMYDTILINTRYKDCKIHFIPPKNGLLTGSVVVILIDIYNLADIRVIF